MSVACDVGTLYSFAELLKADERGEAYSGAVEKVRGWLQSAATDHEWWDYSYEEWGNVLHQVGFEAADIRFSGFCCQGDGASFVADGNVEKLIAFLSTDIRPGEHNPEDLRPYAMAQLGWVAPGSVDPEHARLWPTVEDLGRVWIDRTGHSYVHENTCEVRDELEDSDQYDVSGLPFWEEYVIPLWERFVDDVEGLRVGLCRAIYKWLETEYDYLTSDEALIEMAEANDWMFDEDGNVVIP
jgi:hypothetical protein